MIAALMRTSLRDVNRRGATVYLSEDDGIRTRNLWRDKPAL
jgi:hypothetical protein